ncbi:RnfABCDGE type electron transport complex subunit D [Helcococcus kunzii]|uniref:RnfABCDGE type electron transport complex subunit D n=1 Tax=Helcococcus kunzii TaxID=40091 RepID=UPI0021A42C85|nr:RnfABCDGE type electron transport complex subunit D [Helcococcus kunzii]MCT1796721.1 RnfABCDGE type electron transport complex subunit D [Helcococcus kunzii]MCT1988891.1 RnfABCDGE type electron transport complex subunit D [Helcococcus kunzii]
MENIKKYSMIAPHIRNKKSTQTVMLDVVIALLPALFASVYFFGARALILTLVTVVACVASEFLIQKLLHKPVRIKDLSAVVTGMLLAFNLPVEFPIWMAIVGSIFAIVIVKELFGGIGQNFMNPALAARVFMLVTWPAQMGTFTYDGVAGATPLGGRPSSLMDLFIGNIPGTIGEVSKVAILIGLAYLLFKQVIKLRMPLAYMITCTVLFYILKYDFVDTLSQLLSGGIIFAAVFMVTDYSSSPMSPMGQIVYAIGAGILTVVIRLYGGYPEGVSFAIIIMNVFVPLIDKLIRPRVFGVKGAQK